MSDSVIRVENLGKKYIIGHQKRENYTALRDVIANSAKSLGRQFLKPFGKTITDPALEEFWALKDVSCEIKKGARVGIIGRNGAGKSTFLKILSRITEPTTGRIAIKGRVASLLEVGTGFHPELTGRENIYLNGAILGMSRVEIKNKFDEIVAFAEVAKFLDTPVKHYSSGMYVRLAFAVAAHLEPEILVVDEVLAVGDVAFQKKCLGKMEDVAKEGRTVLFVSHQLAAIENLCSEVIVLTSGKISFNGSTKAGINYYLKNLDAQVKEINLVDMARAGTGEIRLTKFSVEDQEGVSLNSLACGEEIVLVFCYELINKTIINNVNIGFSLHNIYGDIISILYSDYVGTTFSSIPAKGKFKCRIRDFPYSTGRYFIGARVTVNGTEADWPQGYIGYIDVEAGNFYQNGSVFHSGIGPVLIRGDWELETT
jgi:lipopolysaccharide transport system ATP-binding protein